MTTLQGFGFDFLSSLFSYDKVTGAITRKVGRSNKSAGEVVGTVDGKGYLHVSVCKKFIRLHRLAWFLVEGEVPSEIDHVNRNRLDNQWANLRACTQQQNTGNSGIPSHNTSGLRGVSKNLKSGLWHAQIKINGKQTYLGRFQDPIEASWVYDEAAAKHFGAFATLNNV
jgi:hypothetical protein